MAPNPTLPRFAVLQLSGCAGCEVSLLNASEWVEQYQLVYMPLVVSTHAVPEDTEILLSNIREEMEIVENGSYHKLLLFYKGILTEDDLAEQAAVSELETATIGYGLGCWHLCNGDGAKAEAYFRKCVGGKYWPAFGFIAAEAELARVGAQSAR